MALRLIFAGTPEFAIPSLEALLQSEHEICAIFTKPDVPSGRGLKTDHSAVKKLVLERHLNIPIYQPMTLKNSTIKEELQNLNADAMIVIAYGLLIPKEIFSLFKYGCINVHASLLPRWRGAAPIYWAILAGDQETGVTIMRINEGLDTGDMLRSAVCPIHPDDTTEDLHDRLSHLGASLLLQTLAEVEKGIVQATPQDNNLATYATKISKENAHLDWNLPSEELHRRIRAFNPWPVAYSCFHGSILRIWKASISSLQTSAEPGTVVSLQGGIHVATGEGVLCITELQLAGGRRLDASSFLNSRRHWFELGKVKFE